MPYWAPLDPDKPTTSTGRLVTPATPAKPVGPLAAAKTPDVIAVVTD
jgi:hypothetical protein